MHNPFFGISKADELSAVSARQLFVPEASPIWAHVQNPLNQLIVGPRGAGKTMVLRQLDHQLESSYSPPDYIGIYIQISQISTIFHSVFDGTSNSQSVSTRSLFQNVFSDYLWMEIVRDLYKYIRNHIDIDENIDVNTIKRLTGINASNIEELIHTVVDAQTKIEQEIQQWSVSGRYGGTPIFNLATSLLRCVEELRVLFPLLNKQQPCLYLLFDESSPIPIACQEVINTLLQRGRSFCVKLAIRPYEWETLNTFTNRKIELNTDVWPLHLEYSDETNDRYVSQMETLVNKILRENFEACGFDDKKNTPDISRLLVEDKDASYSGFQSVCAASSGNPQNLLQICSSIFNTNSLETHSSLGRVFTPKGQDSAIRAWSKEYEDRNPDNIARAFCRALLKKVRSMAPSDKSIGFVYSYKESEIFTDDYIPYEEGKKIQSAFSTGFLRRSSTSFDSLFDLPSHFHLSRGVLPRDGINLNVPIEPPILIDHEFISQNAKEFVAGRTNLENKVPSTIKAFLSTSFSSMLNQQRIDIKKHLANVGIECRDLQDDSGGQFLFSDVQKLVQWSDITILDATQLRPYTMIELGMCAGGFKPKGVICILNTENDGKSIEELIKPLRNLSILTFNSSASSLEQLAAKTYNRAESILTTRNEFHFNAISGVRIRTKTKRSKCIYLSLVPGTSYCDSLTRQIGDELEKHNWTIVTDDDLHVFESNDIQLAIQAAYLSGVGVIETSGIQEPNLFQCFKLGLFVGKRKPWRVLRLEKDGQSHADAFSSIPNTDPFIWNRYDEVIARIVKYIST